MRRPGFAILTAALFLVPASLAAQQLTNGPLSSTENLRFDGATWVATWGNVYVPPYTGTLTSYPGSPEVTLYCVDYAHEVSNGQTWTANVTNLGAAISDPTLLNTNGTRLGSTGLGQYEGAAYLSSLFDAYTSNPSYYNGLTYGSGTAFGNQRGFYSGLAAAIWNLTTPGVFPGTSSSPAPYVTNWQQASDMASALRSDFASPDLTSFDFNNWWILSDQNTGATGTQEFLVHTTVTPEPATYVLLLTGLVVLFGLTWLRRRHSIELA